MYLAPKDAVVVFVRRSDAEPARFMAGIRKVETEFDLGRNDLKLGAHQQSLSAVAEFDDLSEAVKAVGKRLTELFNQGQNHS
jgi:hypothetical protein